MLEREPMDELVERGELAAYRHAGLLGADGHAARVSAAQPAVGERRGAVEDLVSGADALNSFAGRRVLVTGHTGFKGSWLACG